MIARRILPAAAVLFFLSSPAPGEEAAAPEKEAAAPAGFLRLCDFETPEELKALTISPATHARLTPWHATRGERALRVVYPVRVEFSSASGKCPKDISPFEVLRFDVYNPQTNGLAMEVQFRGASTTKETVAVGPSTSRVIEVPLSKIPEADRKNVVSIAIVMADRARPHVLFIDNLRLAAGDEPADEAPKAFEPPNPTVVAPAPDPKTPGKGPKPGVEPPDGDVEPPDGGNDLAPDPSPTPAPEPAKPVEPSKPEPGKTPTETSKAPPEPRPAVEPPKTGGATAVTGKQPKAILADFEAATDVARFSGENHEITTSARYATRGSQSAEITLKQRGAYVELRAGGSFPTNWKGTTMFAMDVASEETEAKKIEVQFMKSIEPPMAVGRVVTIPPGAATTLRVAVGLLQSKLDLGAVMGLRLVSVDGEVKFTVDNIRLE
ncbi:MAG: hypothetical protein AAB215_00725 [Planctomycetota bacterium]